MTISTFTFRDTHGTTYTVTYARDAWGYHDFEARASTGGGCGYRDLERDARDLSPDEVEAGAYSAAFQALASLWLRANYPGAVAFSPEARRAFTERGPRLVAAG